MKKTWIAGLAKEEVNEVIDAFNASATIRKRLIEILSTRIENKRTELLSKEGYSSPSWAYCQADGVGYERALVEVISLLQSQSNEKIDQ